MWIRARSSSGRNFQRTTPESDVRFGSRLPAAQEFRWPGRRSGQRLSDVEGHHTVPYGEGLAVDAFGEVVDDLAAGSGGADAALGRSEGGEAVEDGLSAVAFRIRIRDAAGDEGAVSGGVDDGCRRETGSDGPSFLTCPVSILRAVGSDAIQPSPKTRQPGVPRQQPISADTNCPVRMRSKSFLPACQK